MALWGYALAYATLHTLVVGWQPAVALALLAAAAALAAPLHAGGVLSAHIRSLADACAHAIAQELTMGSAAAGGGGGAHGGGAIGQLLALQAIVNVRATHGFCVLGTTIPAGLGVRVLGLGFAVAVGLAQLSFVQSSAASYALP